MSKKITILNLNLWLLPKPFARDQKKRFARFIKMVKELQPDIITLQEVFLSKYIKRLHRSLGDYYVSAFPKRFINAPGLVIFTKERPYLFEFHFFGITEKYNLVERLAKKGFLMRLDSTIGI